MRNEFTTINKVQYCWVEFGFYPNYMYFVYTFVFMPNNDGAYDTSAFEESIFCDFFKKLQ